MKRIFNDSLLSAIASHNNVFLSGMSSETVLVGFYISRSIPIAEDLLLNSHRLEQEWRGSLHNVAKSMAEDLTSVLVFNVQGAIEVARKIHQFRANCMSDVFFTVYESLGFSVYDLYYEYNHENVKTMRKDSPIANMSESDLCNIIYYTSDVFIKHRSALNEGKYIGYGDIDNTIEEVVPIEFTRVKRKVFVSEIRRIVRMVYALRKWCIGPYGLPPEGSQKVINDMFVFALATAEPNPSLINFVMEHGGKNPNIAVKTNTTRFNDIKI